VVAAATHFPDRARSPAGSTLVRFPEFAITGEGAAAIAFLEPEAEAQRTALLPIGAFDLAVS